MSAAAAYCLCGTERVSDVTVRYDAGIGGGLGVPAAFYHFAFAAGSTAVLEQERDELRGKGVATTDIADHGWGRSIYFKDPNGLSLEYCSVIGRRRDELMRGQSILPRSALGLNDTLGAARSAGGAEEQIIEKRTSAS